MFQAVTFSIIMGSLWSELKIDPDNPLSFYLNQLNSIFFVIIYLSLMCFSAAPHLIMFRRVFNHERQSGSYRTSSFLIAKATVDIPLYAIVGAVFASIVFKFVGLHASTYPFFLLTSVLIIVCGCSSIQLVSALSSNIEVAMVISTFINGMSIVFAGFYVTYANIPAWWKWVYHISYLHYGFAAQVTNQYERRPEGGAVMSYVFGQETAPLDKWICLYILVGMILAFRTLTYIVMRFSRPTNN
eukprot:Opistho-2@88543